MEVANDNVVVFALIWLVLAARIYWTPGENTNNYTTDAVNAVSNQGFVL